MPGLLIARHMMAQEQEALMEVVRNKYWTPLVVHLIAVLFQI